MDKVKSFIKNEIVLVLSFFLALISVFFVTPDMEYFTYIDFKTLSLLFCLMAVIAGIDKLGILKMTAQKLLGICKTMRGFYIVMCSICFFSSMIITNDVALITFVPLSIIALQMTGKSEKLITVAVFETIAANLGSMLTPIGNPQNLYLFSAYNMSSGDFFMSVLPYTVLSYLLILGSSVLIKKEEICFDAELKKPHTDKKMCILFVILFLLSILTVFRVISYFITFIITVAVFAVTDRASLKKVDYSLLLTFTFLFIFIGNIGRITAVNDLLCRLVDGNEVFTAVLVSQLFSNVPTAILLSGFTGNAGALLIGVNLGGLGTLIASMASLISFKFVIKEGINIKEYILVFTLYNIVFLIANVILVVFMVKGGI